MITSNIVKHWHLDSLKGTTSIEELSGNNICLMINTFTNQKR